MCYAVADQESYPQRCNDQTAYWIVRLESVELLFPHGPTMLDKHLFFWLTLEPTWRCNACYKKAGASSIYIYMCDTPPHCTVRLIWTEEQKECWSLEGATLKVHLLLLQSLEACFGACYCYCQMLGSQNCAGFNELIW